MTEQGPPTSLEQPEAEASTVAGPGPATTGVPAVDAVITEVDRLDEVPLETHLEVFARAHDSLRAALDVSPHEPPGVDPA
jgi:hypothetical protein